MPQNLTVDVAELVEYTNSGLADANNLIPQRENLYKEVNDYKVMLNALLNNRLNLINAMEVLRDKTQSNVALLSSIPRTSISTSQQVWMSSHIKESILANTNNPSFDKEKETARLLELEKSILRSAALDRERLKLMPLQIQYNEIVDKINAQYIAVQKESSAIAKLDALMERIKDSENAITTKQRYYDTVYKFGQNVNGIDSSVVSNFWTKLSGAQNPFDKLNSDTRYYLLQVEDENGVPTVFGGIKASDVRQGGTGDCWIVAVFAGVASKNSNLLKDIITVTGKNSYKVKMYDKNGNVFYVTVDESDLKNFMNANPGGTSNQSTERWVSILEFAVSKSPQIYTSTRPHASIINGGTMEQEADVFRALTGKSATTVANNDDTKDQMYTILKEAVNKSSAMWVGVKGDSPIVEPSYEKNHAFTVIDVYKQDGKEWVVLRNPWGTGEGTNKGMFTIGMDDFTKYWGDIQVGTP